VLAGTAVSNLVINELNGIGNVVNMESNAHAGYTDLTWGIEARDNDGTVRIQCYMF
jgi:hypothetical protein